MRGGAWERGKEREGDEEWDRVSIKYGTLESSGHLSTLTLAVSMSLAMSGEMFHSSFSAGFSDDVSTEDVSNMTSYLCLKE